MLRPMKPARKPKEGYLISRIATQEDRHKQQRYKHRRSSLLQSPVSPLTSLSDLKILLKICILICNVFAFDALCCSCCSISFLGVSTYAMCTPTFQDLSLSRLSMASCPMLSAAQQARSRQIASASDENIDSWGIPSQLVDTVM